METERRSVENSCARRSWARLIFFVGVAFVGASVQACTPDPRSQACTTDDVCREALGKSAYCVKSRCVECVTSATCGERKHCVSGVCESK